MMKKEGIYLGIFFFVVSIFFMSFVFAESAGSEFNKLTYYAEEYEAGNIDYPQLLVHLSSVRENLNEQFGAVGKFEGGLLKQDQIEAVLGKPSEETKWVWMEGVDKEKKVDEAVPAWRKIVFDGNKVRIRLEAWPSIFSKKKFVNENGEGEEFSEGQKEIIEDLSGKIIYRLHFNIEFKNEDETLNIDSDVERIIELAKVFGEDKSKSSGEELAAESFKVERKVEEYLRNNEGKCEDFMLSVFGPEFQRDAQKRTVYEIEFYSAEDFDAILRLDMCDDCEWNWLGFDFRIEGRSKNFDFPKDNDFGSKGKFEGYSSEQFKSEIESRLVAMKSALEAGDVKGAYQYSVELRRLNEVWNELSKNFWQQADAEVKLKTESMSKEQRMEFDQNYGWMKLEQEKQAKVAQLAKEHYDEMKNFYLRFFVDYDIREYSFEEKSWEKRLVELFSVLGREVCNNNLDDNGDESIDCADAQCSGSICGKGNSTVGNETLEADLYCIAGECTLKEEIVVENVSVCGNHICDLNETNETCSEDCSLCPTYEAINCLGGRVIFSGVDEKGCLMEPICVAAEGNLECMDVSDCSAPLCGVVDCVREVEDEFGQCQVTELTGCDQTECSDDEKKVLKCDDGKELVSSVCGNGQWIDLDVECEGAEIGPVNSSEEEIFGDECVVKSDCGGENDVCSNGRCETIPQKIDEDEGEEESSSESGEGEEGETGSGAEEEQEESGSDGSEESGESESSVAGDLVGAVISRMSAVFSNLRITGSAADGGDSGGDSGDSGGDSGGSSDGGEGDGGDGSPGSDEGGEGNEGRNEQSGEGEGSYDGGQGSPDGGDDRGREDDRKREGDDRREQDEERRGEEQKSRCTKDCERPCVEECVRKNCGQGMDCDVDSQAKSCERECEPEESCIDKCMKGGDWWKEYEKEQKIENGVFNFMGSCRVVEGRQEGNVWFGGWGDPFEEIQLIKEKYYREGNKDWCKRELNNALRVREEFEKGFDQEFVEWFFEKHLANSAGEWEQAASGIYELYWSNVDNMMQIARNMECSGNKDFSSLMDYELINVTYATSYGSLEYWEEFSEVEMPGIGRVKIISPYMKVWIFPTEEFLKYEMKEAMKNHEFPGSSEEKAERENEEGLTAEEKTKIHENGKMMKKIRKVTEAYGGNLDAVVEFKDGEEVVFNVYVQVNEEDIMKITPMLPEEVLEKDVSVTVDFNLIYDMIYESEKEMKGVRIESPPWDKKTGKQSFIKGAMDGMKMYFKIRKIVNSAEYSPESSKGDMKGLFNIFFKSMGDDDKREQGEGEEGFSEEDEKLDEMFGEGDGGELGGEGEEEFGEGGQPKQ